MFKKTTIAALALTSMSAVAHPVNEEHTIENLARHYNVEMPAPVVVEKEVIVEKVVIKEVPNTANATDYLGGAVSLNNRSFGNNPMIGDTNYVEGELWFGKGNVHFYGYADVFEDGNTFLRLDPKWFIGGGKWFANYQYSAFAVENGVKDITHYVGAGYRFQLEKGFIDASFNAGRTDAELASEQGDNGYAVLTNGSYDLGNKWSVDGWSDYKFNTDKHLIGTGSKYQWSGNVGVRKKLDDSFYIRVAPQWIVDGTDEDISVHTQIGMTF